MDGADMFQTALSNFATDVACGGAIRHLTDIGYTLNQIVERLDYPTPRTKAQRIMMDCLYESRVLLREEPSAKLFAAKDDFVQEQDALGRRSMRKVAIDQISQTNDAGHLFGSDGRESAVSTSDRTMPSHQKQAETAQNVTWKQSVYDPKRDGKLTELLHRKCERNGENFSYVSCPFGKIINDQYSQFYEKEQGGKSESAESKAGRAHAAAEDKLGCLNSRQRDYLQGIRWDQPILYHRLDQRMLEIIGKLYEAGVYSGAAFFAVSGEKVMLLA